MGPNTKARKDRGPRTRGLNTNGLKYQCGCDTKAGKDSDSIQIGRNTKVRKESGSMSTSRVFNTNRGS